MQKLDANSDIAVAQIWQDFHQQLYAFLLKRTACPDTAQDILQDVFIKVQLGLPTLKDEEKLMAWLFQLCRNALIDHIRKRQSSPTESPNTEVIDLDLFSAEQTGSQVLAEISRCIAILITQLPEDKRDMLSDRELEGMRQQEIADKYELSLSAAKSRLSRGRQELKEKLSQCCTFEFTETGISHECKQQCGCQH